MSERINKKSKKIKHPTDFKAYRDNLALMKLICLVGIEHSKACNSFRDMFLLPNKSFSGHKPWRWGNGKLQVDRDFFDGIESIRSTYVDLKKTLDVITREMEIRFGHILKTSLKVPAHYEKYIWDYLAYGVINAPAMNCSFIFHKLNKEETFEKAAEGGIDTISLKIFRRLSTEEKNKVFRLLDGFSKIAFPRYIEGKMVLKNINDDLHIFEGALERTRPTVKSEDSDYLTIVRNKVDKGLESKNTLQRIIRDHPDNIITTHIKGTTSKDVAREISKKSKKKISASKIRTTKTRLLQAARIFVDDIEID